MTSDPKPVSSTEVAPVAKNRTFTAADKLRILTAYESASNPLERVAVLRREGVYTSHISIWRKARDGASAEKRPVGRPRSEPHTVELTQLRHENASLQKALSRAQQVIEVQGKVSTLLQTLLEESGTQKDA